MGKIAKGLHAVTRSESLPEQTESSTVGARSAAIAREACSQNIQPSPLALLDSLSLLRFACPHFETKESTDVATRKIEYREGDTIFEGHMAWDDSTSEPRPAVLVSHAWGGRDDFSCERAEDLAALGYVGFALDVYGKGIRGGSVEENQALMTPMLEDRALLRRRLAAALACIREQSEVNARRIAAIGYCFGGLCVLDMARSGADLRGVVSFHGLLSGPEGIANRQINSKILVLHGHDDPMVPPDQVLTFEQEMTAAGADWQLHAYGHTQHSFTNPEANNPDLGAAYQPDAARRSWASMQAFLGEVLD